MAQKCSSSLSCPDNAILNIDRHFMGTGLSVWVVMDNRSCSLHSKKVTIAEQACIGSIFSIFINNKGHQCVLEKIYQKKALSGPTKNPLRLLEQQNPSLKSKNEASTKHENKTWINIICEQLIKQIHTQLEENIIMYWSYIVINSHSNRKLQW